MPLSDDLRAMIEHETTEAQVLLGTLAAALPRSVEANLLLAQSRLRRMEYEPALAAYRQVLALDPRHEEALHSVGICYMALDDAAGAMAAFRHALATVASAGALRAIGMLEHRGGRIGEAITAYERLLRAANATSLEIPLALQGLAAALRDAGRILAADRYTQQLIDRFRREPKAVSSLLVMRNSADDFHEWSRYADKANLALAATRRQAVDPAGRVPETFVLPQDRQALTAFAAGETAPALYIVKPIRGSGGQGIVVTDDAKTAIDRTEVVVQRYLDRPWLVGGRKGHCRIYGLITSAEPLRAYVYGEGVVRFAPEPYDPRPDAPGGPSMHITNTALHVDHPDMVISQDPAEENVGMVWSLSALLARITADGGDGQAVFAEIKTLMEWFVRMLAADGLFARQAASGPPRAFAPKLFGLDVLVDADGHPWLIEMQRIPAATGIPLVTRINSGMYVSMFNMVQGVAIDDDMPPDQAEAIRSDPEQLRRREVAIELANRGRFVSLDL